MRGRKRRRRCSRKGRGRGGHAPIIVPRVPRSKSAPFFLSSLASSKSSSSALRWPSRAWPRLASSARRAAPAQVAQSDRATFSRSRSAAAREDGAERAPLAAGGWTKKSRWDARRWSAGRCSHVLVGKLGCSVMECPSSWPWSHEQPATEHRRSCVSDGIFRCAATLAADQHAPRTRSGRCPRPSGAPRSHGTPSCMSGRAYLMPGTSTR